MSDLVQPEPSPDRGQRLWPIKLISPIKLITVMLVKSHKLKLVKDGSRVVLCGRAIFRREIAKKLVYFMWTFFVT